jgi:hypothetical protein
LTADAAIRLHTVMRDPSCFLDASIAPPVEMPVLRCPPPQEAWSNPNTTES